MNSSPTKMGAALAVAALAAAGSTFMTAAHADPQYNADRAYCRSGDASEARDLCLKEAMAAQAERQRSSRGAERVHAERQASKPKAAPAPEKAASTP